MNIENQAGEFCALMEHALRLAPAFANWSDSAMGRLLGESTLGRYSRGEFLFSESERFEAMIIVSGRLTVKWTSTGGEATPVFLVGPGVLTGMTRAVAQNDGEIYEYVALDDAVVVRMPALLILQVLEKVPTLWRDMGLMLMKQKRTELSSLLKQTVGPLPRRLAGTLARLADLYGVKDQADPSRVQIRIRQGDLASILQVTRQSVNEDLRILADRGVIALDYNSIAVLNSEALRRAACGTRHEKVNEVTLIQPNLVVDARHHLGQLSKLLS